MRRSLQLSLAALALLALPCGAATHARRPARTTHPVLARAVRASRRVERVAPAPVVHHEAASPMDGDRAAAIQSALIRGGYMNGEPSGVWDADSVAAMQKLQSDNGWQTKFTPDARALNKLGLGSQPSN